MFGPRNCSGATIIPATAPTSAASPQPKASIQLTRTPTSRDDSGLRADARSARPSFVNRKKSPSRTSSAASTPMMPMYWMLMWAPASLMVRLENPPLNGRSAPLQITYINPFSSSASPSVTMTIVTTGAFSTGRMITRSTTTPPAKAITSTRGNASQNEKPWFISDHAMNVVNVAISPCAKLRARVER